MRNIIILIISNVVLFTGYSQNSDFGNWLQYFGEFEFKDRFNLHHEAQLRNYNVIGDVEQVFVRIGTGINLTEKNNNLLLGYAFVYSEDYIGNDKVSSIEHRIYQQYIGFHNSGRAYFQHRIRFEQQFFEDDFQLRFRYFLNLIVCISKPRFEDNTFYFSTYNEIFLKSKGNLFERNRLYGGFGYKLNNLFRIEIAYLNQFFEDFSRDQLNIATFLVF